jgi:hypothetical protein
MLNPGQPSCSPYVSLIRYSLAVLGLRFMFPSVHSDLLCVLAAESWRRNFLNLGKAYV